MILAVFLIATTLEIGLSFPASGLDDEVNVGKYITVSHKVASIKSVHFSPYIKFSRYPAITTALSVMDAGAGVLVEPDIEIVGFSGSAGLGAGIFHSTKRVVRMEIYPVIKKEVKRDINLFLTFSVPLLFFKNVTVYSINIGLLLSI